MYRLLSGYCDHLGVWCRLVRITKIIYAYYYAGLPQSFSCELQCPDTYHPGTSDRCTIMWERLPTISCNSLHVNVSLRQSNGTLVYSDGFGQSVSSTETTPLNQNTMYTVTIAAENACGSSTCTATNSTAIEGKNTGLAV